MDAHMVEKCPGIHLHFGWVSWEANRFHLLLSFPCSPLVILAQTNRGLFKMTRDAWARLYHQLGTWGSRSVLDRLTDSLTEAGKSAVRASLSGSRGMLMSRRFTSHKLIQDAMEENSVKNLCTWDFWEQACCGPSPQAGVWLKYRH